MAAAAADGGESAIEKILNGLQAGVDVIAHFKALFAGATADAHWWGAEVELTKAAADALVQVLKTDLKYLSALIPVFPQAAVVLTVVMAGGSLLGSWVKSANAGGGGGGVTITLYAWVVPVVEGK